MAENNSWEHPFTVGNKTEPVQSFEAFQLWLEMGTKRSLKAVAERLEKSHDTIKKYSCTWKWSERLQDKLSYENQQIHAKQLEGILASLDVDQNRDSFIQHTMNNLAGDMTYLSMSILDHFTRYNPDKSCKEVSVNLELFERLANIYCKLDKVHTEHQRKYIQLNKECLSIQNFDNQEQYVETLDHGKRESLYLQSEIMDEVQQYIGEGAIMFGKGIGLSRTVSPLEPYLTEKDGAAVQGSDEPEELEE